MTPMNSNHAGGVTMRRYGLLAMLVIATMAATECGGPPSAEREQTRATRQLQAEAQAQVGMPDILNWTERRQMRDILELRDQPDLATFTYIVNMDGQLLPLCRSLGYGLPYSVQYTSPVYHLDELDGGDLAMPQPDPNGLYMPEGLSATWVLCVDPETGDTDPVYVEPEIIVSRFELGFDGWEN